MFNFLVFVKMQLNCTLYANKHSRVIRGSAQVEVLYTRAFHLDFTAFELWVETGIDMLSVLRLFFPRLFCSISIHQLCSGLWDQSFHPNRALQIAAFHSE